MAVREPQSALIGITDGRLPSPSVSDPNIVAWLERLRRTARAEMKLAGLPWTARHGVWVDLTPLRRDPGNNPWQALRLRERPLTWSVAKKARFIGRHGCDPFLKHPDRLTAIGQLLERSPEQSLATTRAMAAAYLAACAEQVERTIDSRDFLLLGMCIDFCLHQLDVERTQEHFRSWFGAERQRRRDRTELEHHHARGHALKAEYPALGASKIAFQIEEECQKDGRRQCFSENIRVQLYSPGGPFAKR